MRASPRLRQALLVALLLLAGAVRLVRLDADPPPLLSIDFLTDEGWWAHNARDHALFGAWILDEHNPPLYGAPLWTATLRGAYAVAGVGLWQTRVPSALAGLATCALVYALARRAAGARAGLAAALLLALDPFSLVHHRSAFVETTVVAWLAASFVVLAAARGRAGHAAAAGALFAGAVLAKLWALGAALALALYWLGLAREARRARAPLPWREPLAFGAGGAAIAAAVGLALVLPHLDAVVAGVLAHSHRAAPAWPWHALGAFGLTIRTSGSVETSGFVRGSPVLLLAAALVCARALVVPSAWLRGPGARMALAWLAGGALQVMWQSYQPDRRWMVLGPAAAALVAIAWAHGGLALPTRDEWRAARPLRRGAALALFAAALALLVRAPFVYPVADAVPWLADRAQNHLAIAGGLAWALCAGLLLAVLAALARALPRSPRPGLVAGAVAAAALAHGALAAHAALRQPATVRDVSRALAAATREWPAERKRMVGDPADTLALETDLFAFLIRRATWLGMYMNLDGWERFEPWIVVGQAPERPGFTRLPDLEIARAADGGPRTRVELWVRDEAAPDVAAALSARPERASPRRRRRSRAAPTRRRGASGR